MLIGELARAAGTTVRALRYYEQNGLLRARRAPNGYRHYDTADVVRVRNIRHLLSMGFTAEDIQAFTSCLHKEITPGPRCPDSVRAVEGKLAALDEKIAAMNAVRDQLHSHLAGARHGDVAAAGGDR